MSGFLAPVRSDRLHRSWRRRTWSLGSFDTTNSESQGKGKQYVHQRKDRRRLLLKAIEDLQIGRCILPFAVLPRHPDEAGLPSDLPAMKAISDAVAVTADPPPRSGDDRYSSVVDFFEGEVSALKSSAAWSAAWLSASWALRHTPRPAF